MTFPSIVVDSRIVLDASLSALTYDYQAIPSYTEDWDYAVTVTDTSASAFPLFLVTVDTNGTVTQLSDLFDASGNFKLDTSYNGNYENSPYLFATTVGGPPVPFAFGSDDRYSNLNNTGSNTYASVPLTSIADISSNLGVVVRGGGLAEAAIYAQAGALTGSVMLNPFNNVATVANSLNSALNAQLNSKIIGTGPWSSGRTAIASMTYNGVPLALYTPDASGSSLADILLSANLNNRMSTLVESDHRVSVTFADGSTSTANVYSLFQPNDQILFTAHIDNSPITGLTLPSAPSGFSTTGSGASASYTFESIQVKISLNPQS